jgi:hypothetical protein
MGAVNSGAIKKYFVMAGTVDTNTGNIYDSVMDKSPAAILRLGLSYLWGVLRKS